MNINNFKIVFNHGYYTIQRRQTMFEKLFVSAVMGNVADFVSKHVCFRTRF